MENIFDILNKYQHLDTTLKKESFIENGLHSRSWKEIKFHVIVEDLNSNNISAYPLSDKDEKMDQMIFIQYHRKNFFQFKKYPIADKEDIMKISKLNRNDKIKGVAMINDISQVIYLTLKKLD